MNERYLEGSEEAIQMLTDWRIAAMRAKSVIVPPPPGFDGTCAECASEIPKKRLALGHYNCVDCQSQAEQRMLFRR